MCNDFRQSATSNTANPRTEVSEPNLGPRLIPEIRSEPPQLRLVTTELPPTVPTPFASAKDPPPQLVPVFPDAANTDPSATNSPSVPESTEELPPPLQDFDRPKDAAHDQTAAPSGEPGRERNRVDLLLRAARNAVALHDIPEVLSRFEELLELASQNHQARSEYVGLLLQAERYPQAPSNWNFWSPNRGRRPTIG